MHTRRLTATLTVFLLFFGITLLDAVRAGDWMSAAGWVGIGLMLVWVDARGWRRI